MILLGWEIGTGKRVEIPETGHLAWFGQTQLSGKTTALEAIAFRGALRAVAFITKQGEGGFLTGRMIPPYFSEPTNDEEQPLWRWVKSILEASQQRKMNFEESWIIRACEDPRQAKTLADVHANIKSLLGGEGGYIEKGRGKKKKKEWKYSRKPVSGMNAGIYTSLKAYFDIVMPQLARLPYTKKLELGPGLNVMDLRDYAMETQALVIRSVMEWVYQHEKNVRVIVPEAQDFVPQGKNSPVKMACETLVRKAGANKNFMWLDSQDMAAVDKFALRACSIVGIGVQTEMHEIDRSLATMFTPTLKPVDVARLKIGEFFVRTSEARVQKCYVQPAWMDSELHAQAIARGEETVASARQMLRAFKDSRKSAPSSPAPQLLQIQTLEPPDVQEETKESPVQADAAAAGKDSAARGGSGSESAIRNRGSDRGNTFDGGRDQTQEERQARKENLNQGEENDAAQSSHSGSGKGTGDAERIREETAGDEAVPGAPVPDWYHPRQGGPESEIAMPKQTAAQKIAKMLDDNTLPTYDTLRDLLKDHSALIEAHDALARRVRELTEGYEGTLSKSAEALTKHMQTTEHGVRIPGNGSIMGDAQEEIYRYVIQRASKDPGVLEILLRKPELRVKLERPVISMDDSTIIGRIARLVHDGYFKEPKNGPTVQKELKRRGCDQPTTNLYKPLNRLTEMGFLTLEPDGYQAVTEMTVQIHK